MIRFLTSILVVITLFSVVSSANASTYDMVEIQEQVEVMKNEINNYVYMKDTCHQMAECARILGFEENSSIILSAKEKWNEYNDQQIELTNKISELEKLLPPPTTWTGSKLTRSKGVNYGPVGKETYYNLNMSGVVSMMRSRGYDATNYPYWVRNDGCKMLGPYIMLAANLNHFSRGSIVECSLGWGIVCDTGYLGYNQLDIAVTW